jgi:hypothetical protein
MAVSDKALPLLYSIAIFLTLALVALGLRLYARLILIKNAGADDWLALCAGVSLGFGSFRTACRGKKELTNHAATIRGDKLHPYDRYDKQLLVIILCCESELTEALQQSPMALATRCCVCPRRPSSTLPRPCGFRQRYGDCRLPWLR